MTLFTVNWEERILTNKDRICGVLGVNEFVEKWKLRQLMHLFDRALNKTKKTLTLNPRLAVAQGFVDTKNCKYRMELLLPLTIEYPKFRYISLCRVTYKSTNDLCTHCFVFVLFPIVTATDSSCLLWRCVSRRCRRRHIRQRAY